MRVGSGVSVLRVAIFGSRDYPHLGDIEEFVSSLFQKYKNAIVVSGGAKGVDTTAEQSSLRHGRVISYRPVSSKNDYAIERWELGGDEPYRVTLSAPHPTFANYASACYYRDALIVEDCDVGVAFWDGHSRGTAITRDFVERWNHKPLYTYTAKERFCASA